MKKIITMITGILVICLCFIFSEIKAQTNLAPNPSFEDTVHCPFAPSEIYNANNWSSYAGSPEYFNSCAPPYPLSAVSVPNNWGGYQQAASGHAYAAFAPYTNQIPNYREFVGGQLLSQLNIGTKYFASFKVALSIGYAVAGNYATDKIGINFSTIPFSGLNPAPITNNAKVYSLNIITDTLNWTKIFGSFIADSSYEYLMLGNFFDDVHTDTLKIVSGMNKNSYYYLDDICLSTDSIFALNYVYIGVAESSENIVVKISPNPASVNIEIDFPLLTEQYELSIYNIFGQTLFRTENTNTSHLSIDISNFPNGILILKILYKNKIFNYKLIKL